MNKVFFFFMLFAANVSCAQKVTWHKVIVDKNRSFAVKNEGTRHNSLFEIPDTKGVIKSDIMVNDDTTRNIVFTKGELKSDTLKLVIHQTDPSYDHQYVILIARDRYTIDYRFSTSGEDVTRKLKPIETKLILNGLNFRKGGELRGYTEYKAKCLEGCWEDTIVVRGNFIITID